MVSNLEKYKIVTLWGFETINLWQLTTVETKRVQLIQLGGYKLCLGMVALAFSTNVNVVKWFIMSCYYENSFYLINPLEEYWVPTRDLYTMLRNLLNNFFS